MCERALELLRRRGLIHEAYLARTVPNVDECFNMLEEEGACIIETAVGLLAVDPRLWREFEEAARRAGPKLLAELKRSRRSHQLVQLYYALWRTGAMLLDTSGRWILPQPRKRG